MQVYALVPDPKIVISAFRIIKKIIYKTKNINNHVEWQLCSEKHNVLLVEVGR